MTRTQNRSHHSEMNPRLNFRTFQGEADLLLMWDILTQSDRFDHIEEVISLEELADWCKPSLRFDPGKDLFFALGEKEVGKPAEIGFSRTSWYSSQEDTRLYIQESCLLPEWRARGVWSVIVQRNEQRLCEIAASQPPVPRRFFQAWTNDKEQDWAGMLELSGYRCVRRFNNMLFHLGEVPQIPLPIGFEVKPVAPEQMRQVWKAQKEMNAGLFENVAENWLEEKYPGWLENPSNDPRYWQLAWDGDQLAGMVLARIDEKENAERRRKHAYTEHIYVRPAWRKRGLAGALIAKALQVLKEQGMEEAELGVDSQNESAAFRLYERIGYKTFSVDSWHRKPMD